ncbi:FtsH-binding integral membrane protein [Cytobacillus eiseniae]|uniref:FtsH-binding integral membrane protein n=1 Tax=Cytobacillus eiseniae TaxID=762947 RepID=A0ABS4RI56_9BACI|nr:DUF1516 family protein [Cytobacillus eiseniae]MBP2242081.1 FtsH-binding integral membrane protein [Cytobacillus eiseniae]
MTHAHLAIIILTIILFCVTLILQKKGRNITVLHMILRVFYLLIVLTGGLLFFSVFKVTILYILKALLGVAMVALFEMILVKNRDGKKVIGFLFLGLIVLIITVYLGLELPLGF